MGEESNYAHPYPAPQAQYNPQEAPAPAEAPKYTTVSRGGPAPPNRKVGCLEGFFAAICCCCCVEECCCDPSVCF